MESTHQYYRLGAMIVLSFIAMYVLMYAMVDSFLNVHNNLNQLYMAGLMTAPMVVFELLLMGMMYQKKSWNWSIIVASVVIGIACFLFIREQAAIGDEQFLRSMIPHHASAILMCAEATLQNPEIRELCQDIAVGQQKEIDRMTSMLESIDNIP